MTQIRVDAAASLLRSGSQVIFIAPGVIRPLQNQKHIKGVDFGGENEQKLSFFGRSGALSHVRN